MLPGARTDTPDWKLTVVLPPAGVLVTAEMLGGESIFDAAMASIHSATGEKCAVLGKVPCTATVMVPIAPGTAAPPGAAAAAPGPGVRAGPPVPEKVMTFNPGG